MKTILRTPFFLILFTIFSVSFSVSSATAQTLPVINGKYQQMDEEHFQLGEQLSQQVKIGNQVMIDQIFKKMATLKLEIEKLVKEQSGGGTNPPPGNIGVPPVINGSYMQQMEELRRLEFRVKVAYRNGGPEKGQKMQKEVSLLRDVAILGELKRGAETNSLPVVQGSYQNHLGYAQDLNFRVLAQGPGFGNIQGFSSPLIAASSAKNWAIQIEKKKQAGGTTPPDGPPSDDPVKEAERKRDLAQQKVTTSQTELDAAKIKEQKAEQTLTTAKTKLEEAIVALQKAEQDAAELLARKKKEEEERLAALEEARKKAEEERLAYLEKQRKEREKIAEAKRKAEEARLAAIEKVRKDAEDAAKKAAKEAARIAAEEAAQQAEELLLAENKATDAKSVRQAAEDALKEALEAAKSGDSTAKLAAEEAQQKADAAKLEFEKQAEAAQKEAKEKARLAAEAAAKQEAEVAAAVAAMQKIEAAQKAAQDLARQAEEHAAKIREAWGLPTTSAESGSATPGPVAPIQEETIVSPGEASISPAVESPDVLLQRQNDPAAEAAALKAAAEQAATESQ